MSEQQLTFIPRNDVETQLQAAQEGRISGDEFMRGLLGAQLFMPVQGDSSGSESSQRQIDQAVPLTLQSEEGVPVLILFTSPERAQDFLVDFPEFKGGLLAELNWILERLGSGIAVTINPGLPVGIDMEPEIVDQMAGR